RWLGRSLALPGLYPSGHRIRENFKATGGRPRVRVLLSLAGGQAVAGKFCCPVRLNSACCRNFPVAL
ncbi:MAG: hypothetical protein ACKPJJ_17285, partial [Planctomycetaceae bacterium]